MSSVGQLILTTSWSRQKKTIENVVVKTGAKADTICSKGLQSRMSHHNEFVAYVEAALHATKRVF
jgi:hypothetical protein